MNVNKTGVFKISILVLVFFGLIVAWLGFGERGLVHLYRMERERQIHLKKIHRLEAENLKLLEEIDRLRNDQDYIESVARRELGLIKDHEILYRFAKDREHTPSTSSGEEQKK